MNRADGGLDILESIDDSAEIRRAFDERRRIWQSGLAEAATKRVLAARRQRLRGRTLGLPATLTTRAIAVSRRTTGIQVVFKGGPKSAGKVGTDV